MKLISYVIVFLALLALGVYIVAPERLQRPSTGVDFSDNTSAEENAHLIKVTSPVDNQKVSSPLVITGEARGNWYFEATFPIVVVNWDGLIIAEGYAEAQSNWMTEDFVPFKATIKFDKPEYNERGAVILHKANASGLPEHDAAVEIPIRFQ